MKTGRMLAFDALALVYKNGTYSNIALDRSLSESGLSPKERNLAATIMYGVLERQITLEHIIKSYSSKPLSKLDVEVKILICMGLYQLLYLSNIPDNAAVDETVALAPYVRKASAKGFINAVLRSFIRDGKEIKLPDLKNDPILHYSVKLSCPTLIIKLWAEQYGLETAIALCEAGLEKPPVCVRVNTLKTTAEKLIGYLENKGVTAKKHELLPDCLILEKTGEIDRLPQFKQGLFHVQDAASQACIMALAPKSGETVLDICSAPGSKSFTMAELMDNNGEIFAFDLYEHKLKTIKDGAKRLGISIISESLQDGSVFNASIKKAHRVLCDVPCSGLGIIRRKPDIKNKAFESISELPKLQLSILKNAAEYVLEGGVLVYSTCTVNKKENEEVVMQFLKENNSFEPLHFSSVLSKIKDSDYFFETFMPHINGCDGFFLAMLQRRKS